jgi:hypothetical protein
MNNIFIHHSSVFVLLSDVSYQAATAVQRLDVTR